MRRLLLFLVVMLLMVPGCKTAERESAKLQVVTTLFPLYDFAKRIGGDKAEVTMLLPPGVEPHSFEPRPEDVVRVNRADLFVYTGPAMEPWAQGILSGVDRGKVQVVEASAGIALQKAPGGHEKEHGHGDEHRDAVDPHVWLDFDNARHMADNILAAYVSRDPANKDFYRQNAASLSAELSALDERFRQTIARSPKKVLLHGGHYAFGYLARRYGLTYISASAVNAEAEPTPAKLAELVKTMRREKLQFVFTEELLSPRVAETIARETGAKVLMLRAAHNVTRDELQRGVSFTSIMEENLKNLETGLK